MIIPNKLNIGDTIGVVAPSNPIIGENIDEIMLAKKKVEEKGFKVEFSKNLFSNSLGYSSSAKEKADDINYMFANKDIKMIWCAKGGENSNCTFEYLDYDLIKENPKIICGYSDITSITNVINSKWNVINSKCRLVTFSSTNFKTIATDETDFSFNEAIKRFVDCDTNLGKPQDYKVLKEGVATGKLVGGNLSLIRGLVEGKYKIDFNDKILFIEELGFETGPCLAYNYLYYMKQNGVFDKISGLWIGNYNHESNISLEQIVFDVIGDKYNFPIIKSNNFGHIEEKIVIPIGTNAKIDTDTEEKIILLENCVK